MSVYRSLLVLAGALLLPIPSLSADLDKAILFPPTKIPNSLLRGGPGAFNVPRGAGVRHAGVDIVANQGGLPKEEYAVLAVAAGKVAYAQMNGTETTGYGYTVVLDHGNRVFTQYSHLAVPASQGLVKLGNSVLPGQLLGYMADPKKGILSSGNVRADVVKDHDKIQLHFEVFEAPVGSFSTKTIQEIKNSCTRIDPTPRLLALGYKSF